MAQAEMWSRQDSIVSRESATALTPGDASTWVRLAHLQQQLGISALPAFMAAANENPLDADAWIGMGLEQELAGHFDLAEKNLLHAAEISREYIPRSSLANFYFRRNDAARFWPWAKQSLVMGTGDQQPIFSMCWGLSSDAGQIDRQAIPDRSAILRQYLYWLIVRGKLEAAGKTAARLLPLVKETETAELMEYCNAQLAKKNIAAASPIWREMVDRHLISGYESSPMPRLVNGRFTQTPRNAGFDWRVPVIEGITTRATIPGLRIGFSGDQPEACQPLTQYIPLESNRKYMLSYEYQSNGIRANSGLAWRVFDLKNGVELTKNAPSLAHEQTVREWETFVTPGTVDGGLLALTYGRASGTTRINGWIQLKEVTLQTLE